MVECYLQAVRILISPFDSFWCLMKAAGSIQVRNLFSDNRKLKWDPTVITVNMTFMCNSNFNQSLLKNYWCKHLQFPYFILKGHQYESKKSNLFVFSSWARKVKSIVLLFNSCLFPTCYRDKQTENKITVHWRVKQVQALLFHSSHLIQCRFLVILYQKCSSGSVTHPWFIFLFYEAYF